MSSRSLSRSPAHEHGAIRMNRVEKDVVHWVWKNWIPLKKLTVLDGDPGLGKSTLLLDIAARLSRGAPMPDDSTGCGGSALLLTAEDGLDDTVRPRLEAANADLERIVCLRWIGEGLEQRPPAIPDDVPALEQLCLEENVRLVVIDPLVAFLANSVDTASDQNVRRVLHLLARVAERCNCAVVLLRHLNKGSSAKAIYRGGGSIGIIGAARSGLLVAADPGRPEGRVLAVTKSNLARPPQSLGFRLRETPLGCCKIEWLGAAELAADDLLGHQGPGEDGVALQESKAFLADFLQSGPRSFHDVKHAAGAVGITDSTLRRAKSQLQVRSARRRSGTGNLDGIWLWVLPDQSVDAEAQIPAERPLLKRGSQPTWQDILGDDYERIAGRKPSPH